MPFSVDVGHVEVRIVLRVVEDLVLSFSVERTSALLDFTSEPIMPAFEAIVFGFWIADEIVVVDTCESRRAQPAILLAVHVLKGLGGVKHLSVDIIDGLEESVDFLKGEEGAARLSIEQVDHQGVEGHTDDVKVREGGRGSSDLSESIEKGIKGDSMTDTFTWGEGSDGAVLSLHILVNVFGDLVETTLKVHLGNGVLADVSPEVLNLWDGEEGLGALFVAGVGTCVDGILKLFAPFADGGMLSLKDLSSDGIQGTCLEPCLEGKGAAESLKEHHCLILSKIRSMLEFKFILLY